MHYKGILPLCTSKVLQAWQYGQYSVWVTSAYTVAEYCANANGLCTVAEYCANELNAFAEYCADVDITFCNVRRHLLQRARMHAHTHTGHQVHLQS
jgi:hypothetical protein